MNLSSISASTPSWSTSTPTGAPPNASAASAGESTTLASGPDVVVTLGSNITASATYDASGRFPAGPPSSGDDQGGDSDDGGDDAGVQPAVGSGEVDAATATDATDAADATSDSQGSAQASATA